MKLTCLLGASDYVTASRGSFVLSAFLSLVLLKILGFTVLALGQTCGGPVKDYDGNGNAGEDDEFNGEGDHLRIGRGRRRRRRRRHRQPASCPVAREAAFLETMLGY